MATPVLVPFPSTAKTSVAEMLGVFEPTRAMATIVQQIEVFGPSSLSVLIEGESGTGKELVARLLHGRRPSGAFCAVNGGALPSELAESLLFGHVRGAFTGAMSDQAGLIHHAEDGTLFLDEISEISPAIQAKLLRVLQERTLRRVGGKKEERVNFRLVSATNTGVLDQVRAKRFREDLYYRIAVETIRLPPLRERPDDITGIASRLIRKHAEANHLALRPTISREVATILLSYSWPGNIRELENVLQRAVLLASASSAREVRAEHISVDGTRAGRCVSYATFRRNQDRALRAYLSRLWDTADGNLSAVTEALDVTTHRARTLLSRHGVLPPGHPLAVPFAPSEGERTAVTN